MLIRRARSVRYIPSFRECIVARDGYVLSSEDFKAGELVTHAQSCRWIVGFSDLGEVLLNKEDPHASLACDVLGVSLEDFDKKIRQHADARQASKPENFGAPGGMSVWKLVLTQRKQGPDTPHPQGPHLVKNEAGDEVRGFKGLRFCILMGGDNPPPCGLEMREEFNGKPIPRLCAACLDCAQWLRDKSKKRWRETQRYFSFVTKCVEQGQIITDEQLDRWPHWRDYHYEGEQLSPGEIIQHVSGRVRGGVEFCAAANGFFQALLADITKCALRYVSRECYDPTYRVPAYLFENSRKSKYAGGPSPLYGSRPILFAHDEIIAEHPLSVASDAARRLSEVMEAVMRMYCPDYADAAEVDPTLMFRWNKSASKVEHGGILVPWTRDHNPKKCAECRPS